MWNRVRTVSARGRVEFGNGIKTEVARGRGKEKEWMEGQDLLG